MVYNYHDFDLSLVVIEDRPKDEQQFGLFKVAFSSFENHMMINQPNDWWVLWSRTKVLLLQSAAEVTCMSTSAYQKINPNPPHPFKNSMKLLKLEEK